MLRVLSKEAGGVREGWGHLPREHPVLVGATQTFRVNPGAVTQLLCDVGTQISWIFSFLTTRHIWDGAVSWGGQEDQTHEGT